jgi:hypothetical protein
MAPMIVLQMVFPSNQKSFNNSKKKKKKKKKHAEGGETNRENRKQGF